MGRKEGNEESVSLLVDLLILEFTMKANNHVKDLHYAVCAASTITPLSGTC
jgi:hypothetical protein